MTYDDGTGRYARRAHAIHCPETGGDCRSGDCSIKVCVLRQQRIVSEQRIAEWEADFRNDPVNREIVALKVVRDLTAIHIPEPGRMGSKKYYQRQRLVAQVLASTIPRTVERFRNQMDSFVAACRSLLADNGDYRKLAQTSDLNGFTPEEIRAALAKRSQKGTAPKHTVKLLADL